MNPREMDDDSVPVFRGPNSSRNYEENLEYFESTRADALRVGCRDCHAPVGQRCVIDRSGTLLTKFPAHPKRVNDAMKRETV